MDRLNLHSKKLVPDIVIVVFPDIGPPPGIILNMVGGSSSIRKRRTQWKEKEKAEEKEE